MSLYLDTSFIVSLFVEDHHSNRATALIQSIPSILIISDFAAAEFASALNRRVRMREMTLAQVRSTFANFDDWIASSAERTHALREDIARADVILRRLDLPIRTPDALNIAMAQRLGAELVTFDGLMADCARRLGIAVAAL